MPSLVVPNTVEVDIIWTLNGTDHAVNVLHYLVPPGFVVDQTNTDDIALWTAVAFQTGTPTYASRVANDYRLARVGVRDLRVANQGRLEGTANIVGGATSDVLPLATCLVATLRTSLAGRRYRGRFYGPGFSEGSNDGLGRPVAADATALQNFLADMRSMTIGGNLLVLGVTSRVNLETLPVVTSVVRELRWATQRRRNVPGI